MHKSLENNSNQSYDAAFDNAFEKLNEQQKKAVEHIDGPLMVIAGPGTGKTQLLAIRIGYILKNTDQQAQNILALTYTDAGAVAMRQRLLQFIGPDAYKVGIYTFHAFCSGVIRDNVEYFGGYRNLQPVSELELEDILRRIIDEFDYDHPLKKLSGNVYYESKRLKNLFSTIKQESWTKEEIHKAVEQDFEDFKEDPNNYYKRRTKDFEKGDLKINAWRKKEEKFDLLLAGVGELDKYNQYLLEMGRFDYNDMILWVIDAFHKSPDLLSDYQERFQYILVDEYQDTNGSQNELLFQLASFWDNPNLFVVGDDDQSIYRFQGANMGNLLDFKTKFAPDLIVLEDNYRSTQTILEKSRELIENNTERLVNDAALVKNLKRSRKDNQAEIDVHIHRYVNTMHEEKDILDRIESLYKSGYDLSKVAVLYRKHSNVENMIKYLNAKEIPLQIKREIDVLQSHEIQRILDIMTYIQVESIKIHSAEDLLFKILHYEYFDLVARDLAKLSIYCSRRTDKREDDRKWRDVINNKDLLHKLGLSQPEKIYQVAKLIEDLSLDIVNETPQVFFEKLFTHAGILQSIMQSSDSTWRLQLVNTFFNFMKEETAKDYKLTVQDILDKVYQMQDANLSLKLVRTAFAKGGVQFTTIHGSKGLEYDIVFLIRGDSHNWKPRTGNTQYSYPDALTPTAHKVNQEDDRRLFYVAMTRAKNELFITYSIQKEDGKETEPCSFVIELESDTDKHQLIALEDESINNFTYQLLRFQQGKIELLDQKLIAKELEKFTLSATGLNKYLRCPLSFYFENILRVPGARNKYNGFGSAMHYALEMYFIKLKAHPEHVLPPKSELMKFFEDGMLKYRSHFTAREFEDYQVYGKENLSKYFDKRSKNWNNARDYHLELRIADVAHKHVPINGMLDRVMEYDDGVMVYDYKTGNPSKASPKLKPPLADDDNGGDYWRQIVFYSLLIKAYPFKDWKLLSAYIPFLEVKNEKFVEREFHVSTMEQDIVSKQIVETYSGIMNQDFHGCEEDDCRWCTFVNINGSSESASLSFDQLAPSTEVED